MKPPKDKERVSGSIRFVHDAFNDIHVAYPRWHVETEDDCRAWYAQYEAYFSQFPGKVDVIFVVAEFRIGPKIGTIWGTYRARMVGRFTRYSIRVNQDVRVSTFTATSAALHGVSNIEAPDIATAVTMIRELRQHGTG